MNIFDVIDRIFAAANLFMDAVFIWGGLAVILSNPVVFFVSNFRKNNTEKQGKNDGLLFQTLILALLMIVTAGVWVGPEILKFLWPEFSWLSPPLNTLIRWAEVALVFYFYLYLFAHEHGENRWKIAFGAHFGLVLLGFLIGRWVGFFLLTTPLLVAFYILLYSVALVVLPTAEPDERTEKWKRYKILLAYMWGVQLPLLVVDGHAWKKPDVRIPGDFASILPVPGLVWARSHQVVAVSEGTKFKRVDGPGLVFTDRLERPEQVFDLRIQNRMNEIEVVSKDGIVFKAKVSAAFRMDPEVWDKELYDKLRPMNTILRGADRPSYTKGSFPYSNLRVQAALGVTSTKAASNIYWDQWVLSVVEDQARKIISQKNLDELWRPAEDKKGANALDKIGDEIKSGVSLQLRSAGIVVFGARVSGFSFPSANNQVDEISKQQLTTWGSEWERKRSRILSEAQAESERAQQEARAYAESLLLNSIAEGLQKTQEIDPRLPRYVIAMRFLSALQDYIHKQPSEKTTEELQAYFKEWQERFATTPGKEK